MKKIALVTGASSGIGESVALLLQEKGFRVYGAARSIEKMENLKTKGISVIPLDITREESIVNCVDTILKTEGRIDVLINNAGYGSYGTVEEVPIEEARRQFEVNLFGLARLTQLVLPKMRENNFGKIVNVSSIGGKVYTPFGAWYHATKHALEGWSDSLRLEIKPFGIDVIIIEPGAIKTAWGSIASDHLKKTSGKGPYGSKVTQAAQKMMKMYSSNRLTKPEVIGQVILKAVTVRKPKSRYIKGFGAKPALLIRKWLGDKIYDRIIQKMM
ncbi:MAG: oxidoreductase [Candidatus Marinimicrobia bacterium]|nr:oxidoreductase [Candidatus Neomarinimicrobiota bacterium]